MDITITSDTTQKVKVTAAPTLDGVPAPLDAPLVVEVTSGDGTFTQDAAEPGAFFAVSGDNPGQTVYAVRGSVLGSQDTDTVTYDVVAAPVAALNLSGGTPEPK